MKVLAGQLNAFENASLFCKVPITLSQTKLTNMTSMDNERCINHTPVPSWAMRIGQYQLLDVLRSKQ